MVFKVKQRSRRSYFETVINSVPASSGFGGSESAPAQTNQPPTDVETIFGANPNLSSIRSALEQTIIPRETYNWPYDFFSLVELVQLEATVQLGQTTQRPERDIVLPQGQGQSQSSGYIPAGTYIEPKFNPPTEQTPNDAVFNPKTGEDFMEPSYLDPSNRGNNVDVVSGLANFGGAANIARQGFQLEFDLGPQGNRFFNPIAGGGFMPDMPREDFASFANVGAQISPQAGLTSPNQTQNIFNMQVDFVSTFNNFNSFNNLFGY